jgi:peptidoglycan/LPS O-acetylase OafA/YrhL
MNKKIVIINPSFAIILLKSYAAGRGEILLLDTDTRSLDGIRFLLALWVACGHFFIIVGGSNTIDIPLLSKILSNPIVAVDGFMMITGFLMTYHYFLRAAKEPVNEFATGMKFVIRRLFRLYPVYLIAIICATFLVSQMYMNREEILLFFTGNSLTIWGGESKHETPTLIGFVSHLFFAHGIIPGQDSTLLSVAWSLSLEMQFYVLFPILFALLFHNKSRIIILPVTVLAVIISFVTLKFYTHWFAMPSVLIFKFPIFLLGMLMASACLNKMRWRYFFAAALLILPFENKMTIVVALLVMMFLTLDKLKGYLNPVVFKFISFFRNVLSSKAAKLGADISYSLYLFHMILMPFVIKFFINLGISKYQVLGLSFVTFIVLSILISYIGYVAVEKPFINIGKNVVRRIDVSKPTQIPSTVRTEVSS